MGFSIFSNNGKIGYNIKNYVADTIDDLNLIPSSAPGSMVFVIDESKYYILNNINEWKEQESESSGPAPSGTIDITQNGENIDIAAYATANVAVPVGVFPEGSIGLSDPDEIYDVTNKASAYINLPSVEESDW